MKNDEVECVFEDSKVIIRKSRKVGSMIKCPYYGYEGDFKFLKTWRYRWWNVYFYEYSQCSGKFRYQVDPSDKRKSYVMRVGRDAGGA